MPIQASLVEGAVPEKYSGEGIPWVRPLRQARMPRITQWNYSPGSPDFPAQLTASFNADRNGGLVFVYLMLTNYALKRMLRDMRECGRVERQYQRDLRYGLVHWHDGLKLVPPLQIIVSRNKYWDISQAGKHRETRRVSECRMIVEDEIVFASARALRGQLHQISQAENPGALSLPGMRIEPGF